MRIIFKEFFQYCKEYKECTQVLSVIVSILALLFSVFSFVISQIILLNRAKQDKKNADERFYEQQRQYETRLSEEKNRREEDKREADERIRICEQPYLVVKKVELVEIKYPCINKQVIFSTTLLNKGRGPAYHIVPDVECLAYHYGNKFKIFREPIEDPIALVNEHFDLKWYYIGEEKYNYRMSFSISYKDASGRNYLQHYEVDIIDEKTANNISYAEPELCKK